jgi:hypothetical protein
MISSPGMSDWFAVDHIDVERPLEEWVALSQSHVLGYKRCLDIAIGKLLKDEFVQTRPGGINHQMDGKRRAIAERGKPQK